MKRPFLSCCLVVLAATPCWSHGGIYQPPAYTGPGDTAPRPVGPGGGGAGPSGPTSPRPGPALGPGPGLTAPTSPRPPHPLLPTTGGRDELPDPALWQVWWSYNHDAYLDPRARLHALASSSEGNAVAAERARLQARLLAVLTEVLERGDKDVVVRQALLALARLARVGNLEVPLERWVEVHLGRDDPSLQEAALLALGVAGRSAALELLRHVLMDDATGRERVGTSGAVPVRLRAFAAYALGLLGRADPREETRRAAAHALLHALGQEHAVEREVRVACVLALGLVPIQPCATEAQALDPTRQVEELHLCGGAQTDYLLAIATDERLDPWFRGHAAAAVGRLARHAGAGFAATEDHPAIRSRDALVRALIELRRGTTGLPPVQHGSVLGLGLVADADGDEVDADARALLLACLKRDEPMAQRFALVALAAVLGRPGAGTKPDAGWKEGSSALLRELARAKGSKLPWAALALAVAGHGRAGARATVPESFREALRASLTGAQEPGEAAACALGLALLHAEDPESGAALRQAFEREGEAGQRASAALALGLLGVGAAQAGLEQVLDDPEAALSDVLAASVGLRLLGDRHVVPDLVRRLADTPGQELDDALRIVRALALLGDPDAGLPLLDLLADTARPGDLRAALVWCLGLLADPHAPDWSAHYANGLDYNYLPRTLKSSLGDGRGLLDWR